MSDYIFDYSLEGEIDEKGTIKSLYNKEALESSIKNFIFTQRGDVIENEELYSPLLSLIEKPMDSFHQQQIENLLLLALETDFTPKLVITNIEAIPDYVNKTWEITIEGYARQLNLNFNITETINSFS